MQDWEVIRSEALKAKLYHSNNDYKVLKLKDFQSHFTSNSKTFKALFCFQGLSRSWKSEYFFQGLSRTCGHPVSNECQRLWRVTHVHTSAMQNYWHLTAGTKAATPFLSEVSQWKKTVMRQVGDFSWLKLMLWVSFNNSALTLFFQKKWENKTEATG